MSEWPIGPNFYSCDRFWTSPPYLVTDRTTELPEAGGETPQEPRTQFSPSSGNEDQETGATTPSR
jgi:hypothetical protein